VKRLDRYLIANLVAGFALIALVLLSLFSLLDFVRQLGDVGKGAYTVIDLFIFIALTLPRRLLQLLPFIGLLGSLLALGWLAGRNELMAMRTAGVSVRRIAASALAATGGLVLVGALIAQYIAPPLDQAAQTRRTLAISGPIALHTSHGFWSRDGRRFINVRQVLHGRMPADIDIYHFGTKNRLLTYIHAARAEIGRNGTWLLQDVAEKTAHDNNLQTRHLRQRRWKSFLNARQIGVLVQPPDTLSLSDLYRYIQGLRGRQKASQYRLTFWALMAMPVTLCAMVLIALPFVFGSRREAGASARLTLGAMLGVAFYVVNQISAQAGLLFALNPVVIAFAPSVVLLIVALALLRRTA
jgi:lipopolysaccharide export system permease protein